MRKGTWRRRFLAAKSASVLGSASQYLRERRNVCLKQNCISEGTIALKRGGQVHERRDTDLTNG